MGENSEWQYTQSHHGTKALLDTKFLRVFKRKTLVASSLKEYFGKEWQRM